MRHLLTCSFQQSLGLESHLAKSAIQISSRGIPTLCTHSEPKILSLLLPDSQSAQSQEEFEMGSDMACEALLPNCLIRQHSMQWSEWINLATECYLERPDYFASTKEAGMINKLLAIGKHNWTSITISDCCV